ncbi:MAG: YsnF/AvaK domain-containing protein [Gammaproteobacteria bacterium]|nr:YsnF/AvaK domain-containing protein [Gammaproteobacteria bacterium]
MNSPESVDPERDADEPAARSAPTDQPRLPAVQEELEIAIRKVDAGGVRVRKVIHQKEQPVEVTLREQHVEVRRVSINRAVDEREPPHQEGDTLIIPVFEYVPIVRMQLMLKEEVHVTTIESVQQVVHDVTLSTEELVIERREGEDGDWQVENKDS